MREADNKIQAEHEQEALAKSWEEAKTWKPGIQFHPEKPLPFYVRDKQNFTVEEMAEWVEQETGSDLDLAECAQSLIELFRKHTAKYLRENPWKYSVNTQGGRSHIRKRQKFHQLS